MHSKCTECGMCAVEVEIIMKALKKDAAYWKDEWIKCQFDIDLMRRSIDFLNGKENKIVKFDFQGV